MGKKAVRLFRRILLCILLLACVIGMSQVFINHAASEWTAQSTYGDFYALKPQTVDVLFFGSSQAARAFIPQELYNGYGLTSYNLAGDEQSILLSYFWLEEALRTQTPQVVVLDTGFLFNYLAEKPMSVGEASYRKALDSMRFSPVKMRAIQAVCQADPSQSPLSYYLPFIRYHDGWQELTGKDFTGEREPGLMGYTINFHVWESTGEEPFIVETDETAEMIPLMKEYLEHITALCEEKEIRLLLVKTPTPWQNATHYNAVMAFADQHGLDFIDFNENDVYYGGVDYLYEYDSSDIEHANHWGAVKLSDYIGYYLTSEYELESHEDSQWDEWDAIYQERVETGEAEAF